MQKGIDFRNAKQEMLNAYFGLEKQFIEVSRIIPLTNKPETFSPVLYNVLQSSCGQIESMMRIICDKFELKYERKKFPEYYKLLNKNGILELQQVFSPITDGMYFPFLIKEGESPFWWKGYNDTKHDLPKGFKEGDIKNTINALAGLYALHCVASYAEYATLIFFDKSYWMLDHYLHHKDGVLLNRPLDIRPTSEFFFSLAKYNESGAPL